MGFLETAATTAAVSGGRKQVKGQENDGIESERDSHGLGGRIGLLALGWETL